MVVVETGIEPPKPEVFALALEAGAEVAHVPALEVVNLELEFSLEGFDAAFVGSPRAAALALPELAKFAGEIFAPGQGTAKVLSRAGLGVSRVGSGAGAFEMFREAAASGELPKKIAWLSAQETAADLNELAQKFGMEVSHFALYRTLPSGKLAAELRAVPQPRKFLLRSGKAVRAIAAFLCEGDECVPFGKSAEEALKALRR